MFQKIFFAAVVSGVIAGLFATAVQSVRVIPQIYEAEKYERREPVPIPQTHEDHTDEGGGLSRLSLTLVSNVVSAIGFALLLVGCFALYGEVDWRRGILWGLGGFIVFSLSPAIGLPPELPGLDGPPAAQAGLVDSHRGGHGLRAWSAGLQAGGGLQGAGGRPHHFAASNRRTAPRGGWRLVSPGAHEQFHPHGALSLGRFLGRSGSLRGVFLWPPE